MGWAGIKNGRLLAAAEKEFDVFVTVDRNLSFQQHQLGEVNCDSIESMAGGRGLGHRIDYPAFLCKGSTYEPELSH